jgi:hypothetical protein
MCSGETLGSSTYSWNTETDSELLTEVFAAACGPHTDRIANGATLPRDCDTGLAWDEREEQRYRRKEILRRFEGTACLTDLVED